MSEHWFFITALFTAPENIGVNPESMFWLLPLAMSIAVVYKATKLPSIKWSALLKESVILFGSIVVFLAVVAVVLFAVTWVVTE